MANPNTNKILYSYIHQSNANNGVINPDWLSAYSDAVIFDLNKRIIWHDGCNYGQLEGWKMITEGEIIYNNKSSLKDLNLKLENYPTIPLSTEEYEETTIVSRIGQPFIENKNIPS